MAVESVPIEFASQTGAELPPPEDITPEPPETPAELPSIEPHSEAPLPPPEIKRGRGRPPGSKNKPKPLVQSVEESSDSDVELPVKPRPKRARVVVKEPEDAVKKVEPVVSDMPPAQDLFKFHLQQIHDRARLEHQARRSHYTQLLERNLRVF